MSQNDPFILVPPHETQMRQIVSLIGVVSLLRHAIQTARRMRVWYDFGVTSPYTLKAYDMTGAFSARCGIRRNVNKLKYMRCFM